MNASIAKLSAGAAFALALVPMIAIASQASAATTRVQVGDLDLSRAQDAQVFQARVTSASKTLCEAYVAPRGEYRSDACRKAVLDEVVSKLGPTQKGAFQAQQYGH